MKPTPSQIKPNPTHNVMAPTKVVSVLPPIQINPNQAKPKLNEAERKPNQAKPAIMKTISLAKIWQAVRNP